MRKTKKLLSLLVCISMIAVTVIIPSAVYTSAESKLTFISLFDLSYTNPGYACENGLPAGVERSGISGFTGNWAVSNGFDGVQEIVENDNGSRSWKLNFTTSMPTGGWLNDLSNEFSIKIAVPQKYVPYIKGIQLDMTNGSTKKIGYKFGVTDGTNASAFSSTNSYDAFDGKLNAVNPGESSPVSVYRTVDSLFKIKNSNLHKANSGLSEKWRQGEEITYLYFIVVCRGCTGDEGAYLTINDLGIVVADMPYVETHQLLDLDNLPDGKLSEYPSGMSECTLAGTRQFAGDKTVITNSDGTKSLQLDLSTDTFSCGTENSEDIIAGQYSTVYSLHFKVPSNHIKLIDQITLKFEKQSNSRILYNFGVTDSKNFSRPAENSKMSIDKENNGEFTVKFSPENLILWDISGSETDTSQDWVSSEFTELFLWITSDSSDGYLIIDEVSYTFFTTPEEFNQNKGFITGFENSESALNVHTDNSAGGSRAFEYTSSSSVYTGSVDISRNTNLHEASGVSFWICNPSPKNLTFKIWIKGEDDTSYIFSDYYSVPANDYKKVNIDFSQIYTDKNGTVSGDSAGSLISLSKEQISNLTKITILCRQLNCTVYLDDFRLYFNNEKTDYTLPLSSVSGPDVTQDGKLKFSSSSAGSDIIARIPVSDGALSCASTLTLDFSFDVPAKYSVTLLGTNDSGDAAHWKWGYKEYSRAVNSAKDQDIYTLKFKGYTNPDNPYNHMKIHEGTGEGGEDCNNCTPPSSWGGSTGTKNNPPSPAEKASVHTILIRVYDNTGSSDQAVTLNSATVSYAPNSITAVSTETGTGQIIIENSSLYTGNIASFSLIPESGYRLESFCLMTDSGSEFEDVSILEASNLGNYYSFIMPDADITITAKFSRIDKTVYRTHKYEEDSFIVDFELPKVSGDVYNQLEDDYRTAESYGMYLCSQEALEKYGYLPEDLTPEFVSWLKETGHHLSNYIYQPDSTDSDIISANNTGRINYKVKISGLDSSDRRAPLVITDYTVFEDGSKTVINYTSDSMDKYFYGPKLTEEFYAMDGINISKYMQRIDTIQLSEEVFFSDFWDDLVDHGFDHVRLPVNLNESIDVYGQINEEHLLKLDKVIDLALRSGLSMLLDLHGYRNIRGDYSGTKNEFISVWDQLAERYENLPLSVAFQLLNEPRVDLSKSESNPDPIRRNTLMTLQENTIDAIRVYEGNAVRRIAISTNINMIGELSSITDKLLNTDNLILDIHYYSPMSFSHSGADWITEIDPDTGETVLQYPGGATSFSDSSNESVMKKMDDFRKAHPNFLVLIGEWGAFRPDPEAKIDYYNSITKYARQYSIARTIWEYGSGWGPYNGGWKNDILTAMGLGDYIS